jgi:hypothetical protein
MAKVDLEAGCLVKWFILFAVCCFSFDLSSSVTSFPIVKELKYDEEIKDPYTKDNFMSLVDKYGNVFSVDCTWEKVGVTYYGSLSGKNKKDGPFYFSFKKKDTPYYEALNICKRKIKEIRNDLKDKNIVLLDLDWKGYVDSIACSKYKFSKTYFPDVVSLSGGKNYYIKNKEEEIKQRKEFLKEKNTEKVMALNEKRAKDFIGKMSSCFNTIAEDQRRIGENAYDLFSSLGIEESKVKIYPSNNLSEHNKDLLLTSIHKRAILNATIQYLRYSDMADGSKDFVERDDKELKDFLESFLKAGGIYGLLKKESVDGILKEGIDTFKLVYKDSKTSDEYVQKQIDEKIVPSLKESNEMCKVVKKVTEDIDFEINCYNFDIGFNGPIYDGNGNELETFGGNINLEKEFYNYPNTQAGCEEALYDNYQEKKKLEKKAYDIFGITIFDAIKGNGINDVFKSTYLGNKIGFPLQKDFIYEKCMKESSIGVLFKNTDVDLKNIRYSFIQLANDVFKNLSERILEDRRNKKNKDKKISTWLKTSPYVVGEATGFISHINTSQYICYLISKINKKELRWDVVENITLGVAAVTGIASFFFSAGTVPFIYSASIASGAGIVFGGIKYFRYQELKKLSEQKIESDKSILGSTAWFLERHNIIKGRLDKERYEAYSQIVMVALFDAVPLIRLINPVKRIIRSVKYFKTFRILDDVAENSFDITKEVRYIKPDKRILAKFSPFKRRLIKSWDFISQMKQCRRRYAGANGKISRNIFKQPREIRRRTLRTSFIGATVGAAYSVIGYLTHPPKNAEVKTIREILHDEHKDVWEQLDKKGKETIDHIGTDIVVGYVSSFIKHVLGISFGKGKFMPTFLFFTAWGWMKTGLNNSWYSQTGYANETYGNELDAYMSSRVTGEAVFHLANSLIYTSVINSILGLGCLYPVSNVIKRSEWVIQFGYRFACSQMFYVSRNHFEDKLYYDGGYYVIKQEVENAINWAIENAPNLKKEDYDNKLKEIQEKMGKTQEYFSYDDELGDFVEYDISELENLN